MPNVNEWKGSKVLITGINGFIGGNLAKLLLLKEANVFGLIRNKNKNTYLYYENLDQKVTLIDGDLTDKDLLFRIISEEQIEFVYHLAAQVEVGVGITNPVLSFETNIRGTYFLLEAVRMCHPLVKSVIIASTDKSYGSYGVDMMPYKEDYPLKALYPYDVSKACGDMIARSYASDLYNLPVVVTRFSNIYGPGQLNFSALVPDAIRSALGYSQFIPRGDGTNLRDFLYIEDVVSLYIIIGKELADKPSQYSGEVFNAGTNSPTTVESILNSVFRIIGNESDLINIKKQMKLNSTKGEIDYQYMDYAKAYKHFKWKPSTALNEGLQNSIAWYKNYLNDRYS